MAEAKNTANESRIYTRCPKCRKDYTLLSKYLNRKAKCTCTHIFTVKPIHESANKHNTISRADANCNDDNNSQALKQEIVTNNPEDICGEISQNIKKPKKFKPQINVPATPSKRKIKQLEKKDAIAELTKKAEAGDVKAQFDIATIYMKGTGTIRDYDKAAKWFLKSGAQGPKKSLSQLILIYHTNKVKVNLRKISGLISESAKRGNADAQFYLGIIYAVGCNRKISYTNSAKWFSKAADQDCSGAKHNIEVIKKCKSIVERLLKKSNEITLVHLSELSRKKNRFIKYNRVSKVDKWHKELESFVKLVILRRSDVKRIVKELKACCLSLRFQKYPLSLRGFNKPISMLIMDSSEKVIGVGIKTEFDGCDRLISKKVKLAVWQRDKGMCVECGSKEKLEYDHIIPVTKGGSNTERNVQLLCEKCNRKKATNID